jgi:uncharacterized membrane protein YccC
MAAPIWPITSGTRAFDGLFGGADDLKRGALLVAERSRFVIRCATAASLAYGLATFVGLQHPVWAPISALIVSQESVTATIASVHGRFVGTLIGVAIALLVNSVGRMVELPLMLQIGIGVALCAIATNGRPAIRVCLWTCPLVLVTAASGPEPALVAVIRGSEVILGAVVGGVTHIVEGRIGSAATASAVKIASASRHHRREHRAQAGQSAGHAREH